MAVPKITADMSEEDMDMMVASACDASAFLKAIRQAAVSQQLARLRLEGLVKPRRDGKAIYYSLADDRPRRVLEVIYDMFCSVDQGKAKAAE